MCTSKLMALGLVSKAAARRDRRVAATPRCSCTTRYAPLRGSPRLTPGSLATVLGRSLVLAACIGCGAGKLRATGGAEADASAAPDVTQVVEGRAEAQVGGDEGDGAGRSLDASDGHPPVDEPSEELRDLDVPAYSGSPIVPDSQTWYVDSLAGDDANDGKSPEAAWKSLEVLQGKKLPAGAQVLLRRGSSWTGSLPLPDVPTSTAEPLVIGAYGDPSAPPPEISGSVPVTGLRGTSGGIWTAPVAERPSRIFVNGQALQQAAHPNSGFLTHKALSSNKFQVILVGGLPSCPDACAGARVRMHSATWHEDRRDIAAYDAASGRIELASKLAFDKYEVKWAVTLENHRSFLDQPGEWFYEPTTRTLSIMPPAGVDLEGAQVRAVVKESGLQIERSSLHVVVDGLSFSHFRGAAVSIGAAQEVALRNLRVSHAEIGVGGRNGAPAAKRTHIVNTVIGDVAQDGISLSDRSNVLVENNVVRRTGYIGIRSSRLKDAVIRHNRVSEVGYIAIDVSQAKENVLVERNVVSRWGMRFDDGGAIYSWDNGPAFSGPAWNVGKLVVKGNLVFGAVGDRSRIGGEPVKLTTGIYLDDNCAHWLVEDNVLYEAGNRGINLHNARDVIVRRNIVSALYQALQIDETSHVGHWWPGKRNITGIDLVGNTWITGATPGSSNKPVLYYHCQTCVNQYRSDYGPTYPSFFRLVQENFYAGALSDAVVEHVAGSTRSQVPLARWRELSGVDTGSQQLSGRWDVLVNPSLTRDETVNRAGNWFRPDGSAATMPIKLAPLQALVLQQR